MSTFNNGIAGLGSLAGLTGAQRMEVMTKAAQQGEGAEEATQGGFASIFNSMIQNVKDTDAEFTQTQYLLATGQLDNPAQLGIAAYKNEIAVDLLVQMRNRALDAYNELKNINV